MKSVQRRGAPGSRRSGGGGGRGERAPAAEGPGNAATAAELAAKGTEGSGSELPFLDRIQEAFGAHDVGGARAHTGPGAEAATGGLQALGVAFGEDVAFAGAPDLFTAAHEAAHIVQQRSGAGPSGGMGAEGDRHERHADAVAARVVAGKSAEDLLDQVAAPEQASAGNAAVQLKPDPLPKEVSATAMTRLGHAERGIEETKRVLSHGAGNQKEALEATRFNSYFRMAAMRDPDCWHIDSGVIQLANQYPDALTAAKAELAQGGNCGEHAMLAFDHLRRTASSEVVNRVDVSGLDHAFVILGDTKSEAADELVVCDPWPTAPTACLWEDHFAYESDASKLNVRKSATGDDADVKAVIAKGLRLSRKGEQMLTHAFDEERTRAEIEKGTKGDKPWIWEHPDAAGEHFDYFVAGEEKEQEQDVQQDEALQDDPEYAGYLEWLRTFAGR